MAGFELKSSQFRREREQSWRELELLIRQIEKGGPKRLTAEELARLPTLYRSVISSLSVARTISLDRNLLDYLENLAGRAYICVYGTKRSAGEAISDFFLRRFPMTVVGFGRYLAASTALLLLGVAVGFLLTTHDQERYYSLMPEEMAQGRNPETSTDVLRGILYNEDADGRADDDSEEEENEQLNLFASFLFTNNAKVGILCFALGFLAGAPVVFLLFYNGLMLGALAAVYHDRGLSGEFWAWVLPHGITEFGAVALCGAAGLVIGMAVVFPGRHTRLDNLARQGRRAGRVVIGSVILFFIAALIEGFFRQLVHDVTVRWLVASGSLVLWTIYFVWFGTSVEHEPQR